MRLTVKSGHGKRLAIPVKRVRIVALGKRRASEHLNLSGLPEGEGNPDDYTVSLPPGVGGGGFATYWPLSTGTRARITQGPGGVYSHNTTYTRDAVDLGVPAGTEVRAGFYGVVARISNGCVVGNHSCGSGYGNYVYLKASDGTCAITAHLSRVSVSLGQQLKTYDLIGLSGNTGNSTGAHLHYDRVNCSNNQSLLWAPIEGGSLRTGTTITSQNRPGRGGGTGSEGGGAGGDGTGSFPAISGSNVVAQGPSNSLYAYWKTPDAQWHGPLQIGGAGKAYSAPAISESNVVAQGPSNSLYAYWRTPDAQWHGPLQIGGAGTTYSAPAISGSIVVAQGPSNSLYAYWRTSDAQWHGPLQIGGPF